MLLGAYKVHVDSQQVGTLVSAFGETDELFSAVLEIPGVVMSAKLPPVFNQE